MMSDDAEGGPDPMPRRLRCPYCGDGISVELVNASPGSYYTDMVVDYIACNGFECRATWDRDGDVRQPGAVTAEPIGPGETGAADPRARSS